MRTLIVLLALLIASPSQAIMMIGFGGGSCASQATDQTFTTTNNATGMYGAVTLGQSITAGATGSVYSITVRGAAYTGGSGGTLVARFGTSANLSSSYLGETTPVSIVYNDANTTYELLFPAGSRPSQTSGNTYYIAVINTASGAESAIDVLFNDAGGYTGGMRYDGGVTPFDMTDGQLPDYDLRFVTRVCQ